MREERRPDFDASVVKRASSRPKAIVNRLKRIQRLIKGWPTATIAVDEIDRVLFCNSGVEHLLLRPASEIVGQSLEALIGKTVQQLLKSGGISWTQWISDERIRDEGVPVTTPVIRHDGTVVDVEAFGVPDVRAGGYNGAVFVLENVTVRPAVEDDVTDLKRLKETLSQNARQLIAAQEEEIQGIGVELHDNISQRLALLQIGLEEITAALSRNAQIVANRANVLTPNTESTLDRAHKLVKDVAETAATVRTLSHRLYSPRVRLLNVAQAIGGLCGDASKIVNLADFSSDNVPDSVPQTVSLCLYRVVQEVMDGVARDHPATPVIVRLSGAADSISLSILQVNTGTLATLDTDPGAAYFALRERVAMVNGTVRIDTIAERHTEIHVRIPLPGIASGAEPEFT